MNSVFCRLSVSPCFLPPNLPLYPALCCLGCEAATFIQCEETQSQLVLGENSLNSQNMSLGLLRHLHHSSATVFSSGDGPACSGDGGLGPIWAVQGRGENLCHLQSRRVKPPGCGLGVGPGRLSPLRCPPVHSTQVAAFPCLGSPSCRAEITPLTHAAKCSRGCQQTGPGGRMSPQGTLVCCDKRFVAEGGDVPHRGAQQSATLHDHSLAVKTL